MKLLSAFFAMWLVQGEYTYNDKTVETTDHEHIFNFEHECIAHIPDATAAMRGLLVEANEFGVPTIHDAWCVNLGLEDDGA